MTGIEICLILIGIVTIVGSFIFAGQLDKSGAQIDDGNPFAKEILEKKVNEAVDKLMDEKVENTERKLEKLSTEKILAVGNYSDNVLADINKNHDEVMFLYGMLNDKEKDVKNTIIDIENVKKSVKQINKELSQDPEAILNQNQKIVNTSFNGDNNEKSESVPDILNDEQFDMEDSEPTEANVQSSNRTSKASDEPTQFKVVIKDVNKRNRNTSLSGNSANRKLNNNDKILDLYKKGKSSIEIAKELHLGIGEVRLVIDLFKNRQ